MDISALDGVVFVDLTVRSHTTCRLWPGNRRCISTHFTGSTRSRLLQPAAARGRTCGHHWDARHTFSRITASGGCTRRERAAREADGAGGGDRRLRPGRGRSGVSRGWASTGWRRGRPSTAAAAGDGVLLRTGWSDRYFKPFPEGLAFAQDVIDGKAPAWPAFDVAATELLADRGVVLIGFDVPSAGPWDDVARLHRVALERNIVLVENLIGMGSAPGPRRALHLPAAEAPRRQRRSRPSRRNHALAHNCAWHRYSRSSSLRGLWTSIWSIASRSMPCRDSSAGATRRKRCSMPVPP